MNHRLTPLLIPLLAALMLLGAGCGPGDSGSLGTVPTDVPTVSPSPAPSPSPSPSPEPDPTPPPGGPTTASPPPATRTLTIEVWFTRGGRLAPTSRTRPATPATSRLALTELTAGPTAAEAAAGVRNAVPAGVSFDVSLAGGVATVDFPASFYAGDAATVRLRQGQVVYTLTQFPTVSDVAFRSGGEPVGEPAGRGDYADLLPAIVVASPAIGARVTSPVTVTGTANVFEATVSIRILDAAGGEIATSFTTATCGSGCRGDYAVAVPYRLASEQPGTVQVFEVSAEDGSRINSVDIPVTLAPSR